VTFNYTRLEPPWMLGLGGSMTRTALGPSRPTRDTAEQNKNKGLFVRQNEVYVPKLVRVVGGIIAFERTSRREKRETISFG
jgi:hypothetical protein